MTETYGIDLIGERNGDGSVTVSSPDLPMFCVVGKDDNDALDIAMAILPDYLKANVPDFVSLRRIPSANKLMGNLSGTKKDADLRAHVIAMTAKESDARETAAQHC